MMLAVQLSDTFGRKHGDVYSLQSAVPVGSQRHAALPFKEGNKRSGPMREVVLQVNSFFAVFNSGAEYFYSPASYKQVMIF